MCQPQIQQEYVRCDTVQSRSVISIQIILCTVTTMRTPNPRKLPSLRHSTESSWDSNGLRAGRSEFDSYQDKILYGVHTDSLAHPASYSMGTERDFPGGKAAGG
jgi:hypothetical protein